MNIGRKLLFLCVFVFAIALACITSAFKGAKKVQVNPYFYSYVGQTFNDQDITNAQNYQRADIDPCSGSQDICGIYLTIDNGVGNAPDANELATKAQEIKDSEAQNLSQNENIVMQN